MSEQAERFDSWGIAEVMGHKKFAGRITEQALAGGVLVRVDVPAVTTARGKQVPEYSKLIGVASIYCITPTSEEVARKAAAVLAAHDADPLPVYIPEERQLASPVALEPAEDSEWTSGFSDDDDTDDIDGPGPWDGEG
jgi:hypothetical protein